MVSDPHQRCPRISPLSPNHASEQNTRLTILEGLIVVFLGPATPGSSQVMWKDEKGRRYLTFSRLA